MTTPRPSKGAAPDSDAPYSFVVVGGGQSAGDTVAHLLERFPASEVTLAYRGYALRPLDESPFVNELFGPSARSLTLGMTPEQRDVFRANYHLANYSAIDAELLDVLYREKLRDAILGRRRLHLLPYTELVGCESDVTGAAALWQHVHTGERSVSNCDALILATGYSRHMPLLDDLSHAFVRDSAGHLFVDECYRIRTTADLSAPVWVQGFAERSHGLSDTLLSLVAIRAGEIADELLALRLSSAHDD